MSTRIEFEAMKCWKKASNIASTSHGQVNYMFGTCPICGFTVKHYDQLHESYCVRCGQKLIWKTLDGKKYSTGKMKTYRFKIRVHKIKTNDIKDIGAKNMRDAISILYEIFPNRFDVLKAELIE